MSILLRFLFPPPLSPFINAMSVIAVVSLAYVGFSEAKGKHLQYSKFWSAGSIRGGKEGIRISSRAGMLALYTPALSAALASLCLPVAAGDRGLLLRLALTLHYLKRDLEVLFVHRYSGKMILDSAIFISLGYFISTVSMIYAQNLAPDMAEPALDLKHAGVILFLTGIAGNFYHHYLLSKLRGKDDKGYKIPRGGLFGLVICPHYLFEIIGFIGMSCISQTVYACCTTLGSIFYLIGRSYATRKWYLSKFDNFPADIKALIPCIF